MDQARTTPYIEGLNPRGITPKMGGPICIKQHIDFEATQLSDSVKEPKGLQANHPGDERQNLICQDIEQEVLHTFGTNF